MQSTAELRKQVEDLTARVAELTELLKTEVSVNPAIVAAEKAAEEAAVKAHAMQMAAEEGKRRHDEWRQIQAAKVAAEEARKERYSRTDAAGNELPEEHYRHQCGMIRERLTGKLVLPVDQEQLEHAKAMRQMAADHRSWKLENDLPVRPLLPGYDDQV